MKCSNRFAAENLILGVRVNLGKMQHKPIACQLILQLHFENHLLPIVSLIVRQELNITNPR